MFKIDPKILVTFVSILVSVGMIGIIATDSHTAAASSDADVKGTSIVSSPSKPKVVTPATIISVKTGTPSTSTSSSRRPYQTDENVTTASADQTPSDEPEATPSEPETPVAPVEPTPTPDPVPEVPVVPAPQPTFSIALLKDQAVTTDVLGVKQLIVPFNVLLETGFVATTYGQPQCSFLIAPAGHNVLCNVSQKEANTGTLSMQQTALSPAGHYEVQVIYTINDIVRTGVFTFDIAAPVVAVPAVF